MRKRDRKKHPNGWTFTQHGAGTDLTRYPCDYRDEFICGFCNGADEQKRSCSRYCHLLNLNESDWEQAKNDDAAPGYDHYPDGDIPKYPIHYMEGANPEEADFLLHGDEPGSAARGNDGVWRSKSFCEAIKKQVVDEIKPASALNVQIGGSHYKHFAIQPIEFTTRNKLGFIQGDVVKRISRYNLPGGKGIQDLEKIKHEIDCLIEMEYGAAK